MKDAELTDGDEIRAGQTILRLTVLNPPANEPPTATVEGHPIHSSPSQSPQDIPQIASLPSLPGFQIEAEIGRGSMGIVYRACRLSDGLTVAVKFIHPARGSGPKQRAIFMREAQVLRKLHHTHIVRYLDGGDNGETLCLVTEYVNGTDAGKMLQTRGPFNLRRAVRMTCQLLLALEYAHERGFVHCDIKPSNIILETKGKKLSVRLADFGLARAYQSSGLSGLSMQGLFKTCCGRNVNETSATEVPMPIQIVLLVLSLLRENNVIPDNMKTSSIVPFSLHGAYSKNDKLKFELVSKQSDFDQMWRGHSIGDDEGQPNLYRDRLKVDFTHFDVLAVFLGKGVCAWGVEFHEIIVDEDAVRLRFKVLYFSTGVGHLGYSPWGIAVVRKTAKKTIVEFGTPKTKHGKDYSWEIAKTFHPSGKK